MASMNVSISDPMREWVQSRIESGKFAGVSDYVPDPIHRNQAMADEPEALIAALIKGECVGQRRIPEIMAAIRKEMRGLDKTGE